MKRLDIEQAEPIRKKFAPDWEIRKGTYLYKKVAFDDYNQTLRFLMAIEKPQIKLDHFADFMNFYNELTIAITTHDVKGLTKLDFELALYIDKALEQMDARQLDENFAKDSMTSIKLIKKYQQTGKDEDAFAAIKHGWNFIKNPKMRSIIVNLVKKVSTENGYPEWNDTVAYIKKNTGIDVSNVNENFADGKKKGKSRPGRVKRSGASCKGSVTALRKRAKNASGEKAKMYHWCANMKGGKKKK